MSGTSKQTKQQKVAAGQKHNFRIKKAKLLKVEFLDGAENKFLKADADQYTNLPSSAKWVDGDAIKTRDRLSHCPRIYVEFDRPGVSTFKLKLVEGAKNLKYSDEEKKRKSRFSHLEKECTYKTDPDGKKVIRDVSLGAAGLNSFAVSCTDEKGNSLKTVNLVNKRRVFIQEIVMKGSVQTSAAANISKVVDEFAKHGIEVKLLPRKLMPDMENIGPAESNKYKALVRDAFKNSDGKKHQPYTLVVGYTGHLAVKTAGRDVIWKNQEVGPGKSYVYLNIAGPGKTNPKVTPKYLWQKIVKGEGWFEDAYFQPSNGKGGYSSRKEKIPESLFKAIPVNAKQPDRSRQVRIDVSKLKSRGKGKIVIKLNWVDRMRAGLSFSGNNLICVCTKANWRSISASGQNDVIVHEMGHKIGMSSSGKSTDKIKTHYYNDKGHKGNHCHHGIPSGQARYDSAADNRKSDCVMYGAMNGHSALCEHCSDAAKKTVIDAGWRSV